MLIFKINFKTYLDEENKYEIDGILDQHYSKFYDGYFSDNKKISLKIFKKSKRISNLDFLQHEILKNELKTLYTAITRTRLQLIIFDNTVDVRNLFQNLLKSFDLFEQMNNDNFDSLVCFYF